MALFTEDNLRNRVRDQFNKSYGSINDSYETRARNILSKSINEQKLFSTYEKTYDIFLSHSSSDAEIVAGLKLIIEDLGFSVYIDWIDDPLLNRSHVTKETALILQERMKSCKSLVYAFSENASNSKWMPWELGYFDALKGKVAVLPIARANKTSFQGTEYLSIYYYIQIDKIYATNTTSLWVYEAPTKYIILESWLTGGKPTQR